MTTQQDMVLDYMKKHGAISSLEAFNELCITRLSAVIWLLRRKGYDIDTNPWDYLDADGMPLNYLQAYRLHYGYSSGPWDYWKGPESQTYWDDTRKCFIPKDEFC